MSRTAAPSPSVPGSPERGGPRASRGGQAPAPLPVRPVAGAFVLFLSTWALSALDASGKWVMAGGAPLLVLCWIRYAGHLLLVTALIVPVRGWGAVRSVAPRNQMLRGGAMLCATLMFFATLSYLPQAEATSINFLAPLIMLAAAPWALGETPRASRWIAALAGLLGVLIVVRPGGGLDPRGVALGLVTAVLFALQFLATRRVAVDHPLTTLIWSGLVGTVGLSASLLFAWPSLWPALQALEARHWLVMASTGVTGSLGHLLQIQAYRYAPASLLAPCVYLQIVSAATLGWLIWGHFPDALTWLGIAIVCASGAGIAVHEWRRATLQPAARGK